MIIPVLIGFSPTQTTKVNEIYKMSYNALIRSKKEIEQNQSTHRARAKLWLGDDSSNALKEIKKKISAMIYAFEKFTAFNITCNGPDCGPNTNAACLQPVNNASGDWEWKKFYKGDDLNSMVGSDSEFTAAITFDIALCNSWLAMRDFNDKYNNMVKGQDKLQTFIHEVSHAICATTDVVNPSTNATAYGAENALALAKNYPQLASNNAENVGLYCASNLRI